MRIAIAAVLLAACTKPPAAREEHPRPTTNVGTGHPYWKQLSRDARASVGELDRDTICFTMHADGTLVDGKVVPDVKGEAAALVDQKLRAFIDARNQHKTPVPPELKSSLDGWVCMPLDKSLEPDDDAAPVARPS